MPVDPQIQALLDAGRHLPRTETLTPTAARAQYEARIAAMAPPAKVARVEEREIPGPDGAPLRLRVYTPEGRGPFPLLVFYHGGGLVLCSLDTHDGLCRTLAAGAGCVVASVDYRLRRNTLSRRAPTTAWPPPAGARRTPLRSAPIGAARHRRRQRRRQPRRGHRAAARDEGGPRLVLPAPLYPVTDWTAGLALLCRERRGLRADARPPWAGSGATTWPTRRDGSHPHASPLRAARPRRAAARPGHHRRIRPAARRGRGLCRGAARRRRAGRRDALARVEPRLLFLGQGGPLTAATEEAERLAAGIVRRPAAGLGDGAALRRRRRGTSARRRLWWAFGSRIRKFRIMPVSSCGRMWQCSTALPVNCLNFVRRMTVVFTGTQTPPAPRWRPRSGRAAGPCRRS